MLGANAQRMESKKFDESGGAFHPMMRAIAQSTLEPSAPVGERAIPPASPDRPIQLQTGLFAWHYWASARMEVKAPLFERTPRTKMAPPDESNSTTPRMSSGLLERTGRTNEVCVWCGSEIAGSFEITTPFSFRRVTETVVS